MSAANHPDPAWWQRCSQVKKMDILDLCSYCGHIRALHLPAGICRARSTSIKGNPRSCDCTNQSTGALYRDPKTLIPKPK